MSWSRPVKQRGCYADFSQRNFEQVSDSDIGLV